MNIPLCIDKFEHINKITGEARTKLKVWYNKKSKIVDIPFDPYFYSYQKLDIGYKSKVVQIKRLSDLKIVSVYKYLFPSVKLVPIYRTNDAFEADIPFLQRVAIDKEDFYTQFNQDDKLDILYFDIETDTAGMFPKPERNMITTIGFSVNEEPVQKLSINRLDDGDEDILTKFMEVIRDVNPDIIVGYNCIFFDIPYILKRCQLQGINTSPLTRESGEAYFMSDTNELIPYIRGRCIFDVFDEVRQDQTLYGISGRGMKEVANWFNVKNTIRKWKGYENYDVITEYRGNMRELIGTKELDKYVESDVLITRALSDLYFKNILTFARMFKLPLNIVTRRSANLLNTVYYARELNKDNIKGDLPNYKKYPQIFGNMILIEGRSKFVNGTGYQGAYVDIFKKGLIKNFCKVDFAGMYPTIIATFELSPETTRIIDYKKLGEFNYKRSNGKLILEYPDTKIGKNVIIEIKLNEHGFLPRISLSMIEERKGIKKMLKDPKYKDRYEELTSTSWCLKVLNNAGYGTNGAAFFRYGDVAVSMTITALGRILIQKIIDMYKGRNILVDTDGVYIEGKVSEDAINQMLEDFIIKDFGLSKNYLSVEMEDVYPAGFFIKKKNYMLYEDGNIIKHGATLKGTAKNRVFTRALDMISEAIFEHQDDYLINHNIKEAIYSCFDMKDFIISDFAMKTMLHKHPSQYANSGCLQVNVARQAKRVLDIDMQIGDSIEYVKEYDGYKIVPSANIKKIDKPYYKRQILRVLELLSLTHISPDRAQTDLNDWSKSK